MKRILFCLVCFVCFSTVSFAGNGYYTVTTNGVTSEKIEYVTWKTILSSVPAGTSKNDMTVVDIYNVTYGYALSLLGDETVEPVNSTTLYQSAWLYAFLENYNSKAYTKFVFHNCVFNSEQRIGFCPVRYNGVQLFFDKCYFNNPIYGMNGFGNKNVDVGYCECVIENIDSGDMGVCYGDLTIEKCEFRGIEKKIIDVTCGYRPYNTFPLNSFDESSSFFMKDCIMKGDYPENDVKSIKTQSFSLYNIGNFNINFDYYKIGDNGYEYISNLESYYYIPETGYRGLYLYIPGKIFITIPETGYTTYSTSGDKNIDISTQISNFKAYRATKFIDTEDYTHLYFTSTDKLNKNEGYLLRGIPGKYEVEKASDGTIYPQGNNGMKRGDGNVHPDCFALSNKSAGLGFYKLSDTANVPVGKAYLDITDITESSNSAKVTNLGFGSMFFDEQTTLIENIHIKSENHKMYNLAGQQVNNNYHGYVILKGKKYITK